MQRGYGCAFHHHHGAVLDMRSKRGGVAAMQLRLGGVEDGRSASRFAEFPNGDAEAFRLVGEVVLDSRAREMHDADRQYFEHGVVASERCCLSMLRPVRLESDLWYLAVISPFGGDQLGAFW